MRLAGFPVELSEYPAETVTNRQFLRPDLAPIDRFYLPDPMSSLVDEPPLASRTFIEDDNRGAILPDPIATLDGLEFYLSIKGIGSTIDPYSWRPLDRAYASELSDDPELRSRILAARGGHPDRFITGELWLRGSPYGGQGLEHATTAMAVSEMADLTSIEGFLVAPVVKIAFLPKPLEAALRSLHWYRKYPGRIVQELRLVPSNVRVFFHARSTVGNSIGDVFDRFAISSSARATRFETRFLATGSALLTLFARTLTRDPANGRYTGLDFHDVWLDKDAVVAPDGSVYFVDLEGIAPVTVEEGEVREKIEDQIYRSLYEMMFAYEQIERERTRRFGSAGGRKEHFAAVLREALRSDPYLRLRGEGRSLDLQIRNKCEKEDLVTTFRVVEG